MLWSAFNQNSAIASFLCLLKLLFALHRETEDAHSRRFFIQSSTNKKTPPLFYTAFNTLTHSRFRTEIKWHYYPWKIKTFSQFSWKILYYYSINVTILRTRSMKRFKQRNWGWRKAAIPWGSGTQPKLTDITGFLIRVFPSSDRFTYSKHFNIR